MNPARHLLIRLTYCYFQVHIVRDNPSHHDHCTNWSTYVVLTFSNVCPEINHYITRWIPRYLPKINTTGKIKGSKCSWQVWNRWWVFVITEIPVLSSSDFISMTSVNNARQNWQLHQIPHFIWPSEWYSCPGKERSCSIIKVVMELWQSQRHRFFLIQYIIVVRRRHFISYSNGIVSSNISSAYANEYIHNKICGALYLLKQNLISEYILYACWWCNNKFNVLKVDLEWLWSSFF